MTFGVTPNGFNSKTLSDIVTDLDNAMLAQFGEINLDPQSVFGQLIGVMAKAYADIWENMSSVYNASYPQSATGVSLDNAVALNGISRKPATQTTVYGVCTGTEGTLLPAGTLASIPSTDQIFQSISDVTISSANAYSVLIDVTLVTTNAYIVQINGQNFIYSLPIITFTGNFVTGNSIIVTMNGVDLTAVPFLTDNDTTLTNIANGIQTAPGGAVLSATAVPSNVIDIIPNSGFQVVINDIKITGGASQPTWVITYANPGSIDNVVNGLAAILNADTAITASNISSELYIVSNTVSVPFSASPGANLTTVTTTTADQFISQVFGPIPCPVGTLTNIVTPLAGWDSITNPVAGVTGTLMETDASLRLRQISSISQNGDATVEAIRAHLLAIPGVTAALVFENSTVYEADLTITLSADLASGNDVAINWSGDILLIPFDTDNLTTMTDISLILSAQPQVATCIVTGAGNHELLITFNEFQDVRFVSSDFVIAGGSPPVVTVSGGRPAKSFEAVVQGGDPNVIAETIWLSKPAGIQTYGNTEIDITDSQGGTQAIFFSIPTPIYIWVEVALTLYTEEPFPVDGAQLVAQAILNYGNTLQIDEDVLLQRVNCQIFTVSGIASGNMEIAFTLATNISPSYSTSDIPIAESSIAVFDLSRISVTVV